MDQLEQWFSAQQNKSQMVANRAEKPLQEPWRVDAGSPTPVYRDDGKFFHLIHVEVSSSKREAGQWSQPMLEQCEAVDIPAVAKSISGLVVLFRGKLGKELKVLVQALAEPGNETPGRILLAPTIQMSISNMLSHRGKIPFCGDFDLKNSTHVVQAKDGGRFFGKRNLLSLQEISDDEVQKLILPENFIWATREEIRSLQKKGLANEHLNEVLGVFS